LNQEIVSNGFTFLYPFHNLEKLVSWKSSIKNAEINQHFLFYLSDQSPEIILMVQKNPILGAQK
jgi:hypothetical protein